ncbi:hypothetical protein BJX63DRAFT_144841 [Aspergillus granulosus]|uniref:Protein kinase domain-containing protein n=1 Tax=Aspergillus granulosus TaxID=176169 RepID=A0ABR4HNP6_9EURO
MTLSEEDLKIISDHPLDDTIHSTLRNVKTGGDATLEDIASLLGALILSQAAFDLRPLDGSGSVASRLLSIRQNIREISAEVLRPLVRAVTANLSDVDIWKAVLDLIESTSPSTPPPSSIPPTYLATPVKTSSSRLADSETRDIVEQELFEIRDCTHRGVPGFFEKHFDPSTWSEEQNAMLGRIMAHHNGSKWTSFPAGPWELQVWEWLAALEKDSLAGATYILHSTRKANKFAERKGQMDIFFQKPKKGNRRFIYKDILVVGEYKRSEKSSNFKACLIQLLRYVRNIYAEQPMRCFVHAFTIRGTTMELWVLDRSGPYSSGEFDIYGEPDKLARALVAYATMNDAAMGLDMFIMFNKHRYVIARDAEEREKQVELKMLLVRQRAVVCRGTTCFCTPIGVAKFSWRLDKQPSEVKHLKLAKERGVEGIAKVVAHCEFTSIADLWRGLDFSVRTQYIFQTTAYKLTNLSANVKGLHSSKLSRKRKLEEDTGRLTKQCFNSPRLAAIQQTGQQSSDRARPSLYTPNQGEPYNNRILSCLVISPAGRVISNFHSIQELLEALRDAIRAYQSLYVKGQILHRDILPNNIIITGAKKSGDFKGMLIDLDMAKERESGPSGIRHRTGTLQFMAIEVLRGIDHTYCHDLESFFYVLLWMCARCSWTKFRGSHEAEPLVSDLRYWEVGSFEEIARAKEGDMAVIGLESIMKQFPDVFHVVKPLCLKLRMLLFPFDKDLRMSVGTPAGDPDQLYNAIIAAYQEAINRVSDKTR